MKMVMSNAIIKQLEKNGIQIEDDDE
jgi:hypothetical protein